MSTLIEELKDGRAHPHRRHFLEFGLSKRILRNVLRDTDVYAKHPEPEVVVAIMVAGKFRPQLQALLCNHAKAAKGLNIEQALWDDLHD